VASRRYGFLNAALRQVNWVALGERRKRGFGEGVVNCVSGRGDSGQGSKLLAGVRKSPFGHTSGVVCRGARLMAENEATSGAVKSSGQPMRLSEKFARSEAFHDAHGSLTAGTRMAGRGGTARGEGRQGEIQQLPA
jgi:hypothetical protein